MIPSRNVLALSVVLLLPLPAAAQTVEELAAQYVSMPSVQLMMDEMFSPEAMAAQLSAVLPPGAGGSQEQLLEAGALMSQSLATLRPEMEASMRTRSAEFFSADELRALIDFYASEHGSSVMTKMQPFMAATMGDIGPRMMEMQMQLGPELMEILGGQ